MVSEELDSNRKLFNVFKIVLTQRHKHTHKGIMIIYITDNVFFQIIFIFEINSKNIYIFWFTCVLLIEQLELGLKTTMNTSQPPVWFLKSETNPYVHKTNKAKVIFPLRKHLTHFILSRTHQCFNKGLLFLCAVLNIFIQ